MRLLFIVRTAPYGTIRGREALDAVLAASAFEQEISLLYLDDGIFQLLVRQDGAAVGQKTASGPIAALPHFDVDRIFGGAYDLCKRGLRVEDLIPGVQLLENEEIGALIAKQDLVLSF